MKAGERPLARLELMDAIIEPPVPETCASSNPSRREPPRTGIASPAQSHRVPRVPRFAPRERLRVAAHRLEPAIPVALGRRPAGGAAPLYVKAHSYGEYVFDWGWADAYERHGVPTTRSFLCAVPFTPATGARLLGASAAVARAAREGAAALRAHRRALVAAHPLSARRGCRGAARRGLRERRDPVPLRNAGYADFEAFLAALSHDKRKKIRQERKRVAAAGVTCAASRGTRRAWPTGLLQQVATGRTYPSTAHAYLTRESSPCRRRMPATCCW